MPVRPRPGRVARHTQDGAQRACAKPRSGSPYIRMLHQGRLMLARPNTKNRQTLAHEGRSPPRIVDVETHKQIHGDSQGLNKAADAAGWARSHEAPPA